MWSLVSIEQQSPRRPCDIYLKWILQKCIFSNCWRTSVLFGEPFNPYFGLLVVSNLGFKARVDSLACVLYQLCATDSTDSLLVWHLLTSWQPAWQLNHFNPHTCEQALVGIESSMLPPHSMSQDRRSADWATLVRLCFRNVNKNKMAFSRPCFL